MKTLILAVLLIVISSISAAINVVIPDANFKEALISSGVDNNNDGEISYSECEAINTLNINSKFISDLKGIEAFINLDSLNCCENLLSSLDISSCTNLKYLSCYWNHLTSLDLSKNEALRELNCSYNLLTNLDVSHCYSLTYLACQSNLLLSLDITNNHALINLACFENPIANLDLSKNFLLSVLKCGTDSLTSLDLSNNTALTLIQCGSSKITSLDLSKNILLYWIHCEGMQLVSLKVPKHGALTELNCSNNKLTSLDVSGCDSLMYLFCNMNQLSYLNLSGCFSLKLIDCDGNQLVNLDISDSENLKTAYLREMPTLNKVCVWNLPRDIINPYINTSGSPNVNYSIDCWTQDNLVIPDKNFKNALRVPEIDTDGNRKISYSEAEEVTDLNVNGMNISDLTGIEAFVNLKVLDCSNNKLKLLNITNCTLLNGLSCAGNQLNVLNLIENTNLLTCYNDPCNAILDISNMPTLHEVCVGELPFPSVDKIDLVDTTGSPNIYYSTECLTDIKKFYKENTISTYLTADDIINIKIEHPDNARIEIYNVSGTLLFNKEFDSEIIKIDVSGYSPGVYLVRVKQNSQIIIKKVLIN
jgi:hypothetical protein